MYLGLLLHHLLIFPSMLTRL
uniref:Uncharacterized protein n=1 Tax=Rhizophora mucronata TaxID=61149 RepID=A0A2P2NUU8_RHIMU